MSEKKPNAIDKHVGNQLRLRRNLLNLSQEKLGEKIGVTFQQVQKYEKGLNRVGASRLQGLAEALEVQVAFFFEDAPKMQVAESSPIADIAYKEFCSSTEGIELMRAFSRITDPKIRAKVLDLAKALAKEQESD